MKRKILYFCPDYYPSIVKNNWEPILRRVDIWLDFHFEVVRISSACSLAREVEKHTPDALLFDGGIEGLNHLLFPITELDAYPHLPRLGFCRNDALSPYRFSIFQYLERLGVKAFFCLGDLSIGEASEHWREKIMYVPWFFDPAIFHDYGQHKSIPVLLAGNFEHQQYPWRAAVRERFLEKFPALYLRHPGYNLNMQEENPLLVHGEEFARTMNSAWICPTSAGFKNFPISKHLEIPAARSCLITDWTPSLDKMGFKQLENCVFAAEHEAIDAALYLFNHRSLLQKITDAGYEFVHQNHSYKQRTQLVEFIELTLKNPNKKIIQSNPFGPLSYQEEAGQETLHMQLGSDRTLLTHSDRALFAGRTKDLRRLVERLGTFCGYMTEYRTRLAFLEALEGDFEKAHETLTHMAEYYTSANIYGIDPCEKALSIVLNLILSKPEGEIHLSQEHGKIHPALEAIIDLCDTPVVLVQETNAHQAVRENSIHAFPIQTKIIWKELFGRILTEAQKLVNAQPTSKSSAMF